MDRRERIEAKLTEGLAPTHIEVIDESHLHAGHAGARDGAGHYRAVLVSDRFEGLSRVKRQQLVYGLLDGLMGPEIHALSMQTLTPSEWASKG